jgi:hypothetical protein
VNLTLTRAKSLMIFDTQTEQVVGNRVYDVKTEPKNGQFGKFETTRLNMLAPADTSPVNSRPKFLRGFAPLGFGRLMVPRCKAKGFSMR